MKTILNDWLYDISDGFLSLVFPYRCAGCDRIDVKGLCTDCVDKIFTARNDFRFGSKPLLMRFSAPRGTLDFGLLLILTDCVGN